MLTGKQLAVLGAILSAVAVAGGAFGAHALKEMVTPDRLETFKTAISYMQWHAFAVMFLGYLFEQTTEHRFRQAATFMLLGIIIFCGSLIILVLTGLSKLGAVAPLGGVFFILSWAMVASGFYRTMGSSVRNEEP